MESRAGTLTFPTASPIGIDMSIRKSRLKVDPSSGEDGSTMSGRMVAVEPGIPGKGCDPMKDLSAITFQYYVARRDEVRQPCVRTGRAKQLTRPGADVP